MEVKCRRNHSSLKNDYSTPYGFTFSYRANISRFYHYLRISIPSLIIILIFPIILSAKEKIIPLTPGITEILHFLGEDKNIIAVPEKTLYPPSLENLPKIGPFYRPDVEAIIKLDPTHVIGVKFQEPIISQLKKIGIKTLIVQDETINDIIRSVEKIGAFIGKKKRGEVLATKLQKCIRLFLNAKNNQVPFVAILDKGEYKFYVAGPNSFVGELIQIAGGKNLITTRIPYPRISLEELIALKPKIIIDLSRENNFNYNKWLHSKVVKLNNPLLTIPGPRIIKAIKIFRKVLGTREVDISCSQ